MKKYHHCFRTLFLSLLMAFVGSGHMLHAAPADGESPLDSVEIGLITCTPHDEVYSLYGHTALRWHDLRTGEDLVFNYGIFDFKKPYFTLRFVFGLTDYELGVAPTKPFLQFYERWGSQVTEQVLNLTAREKLQLTMALHENARPENRVYRYNFFFDNCATRPRDMVERNVDGEVVYAPGTADDVSFRDMVRQQTRHYPWATFGNDILLGLRADMKTTQREQEFLPDNLRHDFDRAVITTNGEQRPLVSERRQLVPPGVQVMEEGFPLRPLTCALLLLAVALGVFAYEQFRHTVARWFDIVLMLLTGLAGCVLFVMVFSEHPATSANLHLLLLNPLPLFFIWKVARGRKTRWFAIEAVLTLLFCAGGLWQSYAEGMYVVAACVLTRCWRHLFPNGRHPVPHGRSLASIMLCTVLGLMPVATHAVERADGVPRLVVAITIDQMRNDYLNAFAHLYGPKGFKRLMDEGTVCASASYPFTPVDRASAAAALATGVSPYYNSIVGQQWLNRETLRPVWCTDDAASPGLQTSQTASPANLSTSTIADELKVATGGQAIVWAVAPYCDAAVMSAGHAADGALWIDDAQGLWCSSQYYFETLPQWVLALNKKDAPAKRASGKDVQRHRNYKRSAEVNGDVTTMARYCLANAGMGTDATTDMLCVTYFAGIDESQNAIDTHAALQHTYVRLDREIATLVAAAEQRAGKDNVLFVVTSTGYFEETAEEDYQKYRIPTGTFYMNRTADLLNMYMGAIWGQGRYVEKTFRNHIFLNHALLDKKTISIGEATRRAQELLVMMSGVRNVYTSLQLLTLGNDQIERVRNGYSAERGGDLVIETAPGWCVLDESTGESEYARASSFQFPIVFFGTGIEAQHIQTPVTTDRIAPTIARAIRVRTPNACSAEPLF